MTALFWLILGALIGAAAAQKKGFSMAGGVLVGALLGPLAILMFAASSGATTKKCPYCAEFIKKEAAVCKHCHKELPPQARSK